MGSVSITALEGIPLIQPGDNLAELIVAAAARAGLRLGNGDVIVVCQKAVSKAEGRVFDLKEVTPSELSRSIGARWEKDPRVVELVLRQTNRIVRMDRGVIIVETGPGWICANAGLDESNSMAEDRAILLPVDPDASAAQIRAELKRLEGAEVAVLVSDTFGRPWREGLTEVCLGISGMEALLDLRGTHDLGGRELSHTVVAVADELACAAGLLMEKASGVPAVLIRGYAYKPAPGTAKTLIRAAEADLFR
jgi:coenzyme F420-0:L-glutamate ligase / coenzyme F420-1:gamma-L-glutamate ligase